MPITPAIAIHVTAALAALVLGPVALWARRARAQHPRLHRAAGYAWITLMILTAVSAIFISSSSGLPHVHGFSPIHLLIPVTLGGIAGSFWLLAKGRISGHRRTMQGLYFGACVVAGAFALAPQRFLGQFLFGPFLQLT